MPCVGTGWALFCESGRNRPETCAGSVGGVENGPTAADGFRSTVTAGSRMASPRGSAALSSRAGRARGEHLAGLSWLGRLASVRRLAGRSRRETPVL